MEQTEEDTRNQRPPGYRDHTLDDAPSTTSNDARHEIAILITCYNKADYIGECIASAMNNDCAVIVVDDCSTDASAQEIARFPEAIRIFHEKNQGPSAATITGARAASERGFTHLVLLDGDDVIAPNAVDYFRHVFAEYDADAIYPGWLRHERGDARLEVRPTDLDADVELETDPLSRWLRGGYISSAVCAPIDLLIDHVDPGNRIQDYEVAFAIHAFAERVAFADAITHYYSAQIAGKNLGTDLRLRVIGFSQLYLRTYPLVANHPDARFYTRRALNRALKAHILRKELGRLQALWLLAIKLSVRRLLTRRMASALINYILVELKK